MGSYPYTLAQGGPEDLDEVRGLYRECAAWLGRGKQTDQWSKPWPDRVRHRERMQNDLLEGKTWLVWDHATAAGTITLDTQEPLTASGGPVWPAGDGHETAVYVRRCLVRRRCAGRGIGAALLDWAAEVAMRNHGAALIRLDVWTTNYGLHAYYQRQRFTRCPGSDPAELTITPRKHCSNGRLSRPARPTRGSSPKRSHQGSQRRLHQFPDWDSSSRRRWPGLAAKPPWPRWRR